MWAVCCIGVHLKEAGTVCCIVKVTCCIVFFSFASVCMQASSASFWPMIAKSCWRPRPWHGCRCVHGAVRKTVTLAHVGGLCAPTCIVMGSGRLNCRSNVEGLGNFDWMCAAIASACACGIMRSTLRFCPDCVRSRCIARIRSNCRSTVITNALQSIWAGALLVTNALQSIRAGASLVVNALQVTFGRNARVKDMLANPSPVWRTRDVLADASSMLAGETVPCSTPLIVPNCYMQVLQGLQLIHVKPRITAAQLQLQLRNTKHHCTNIAAAQLPARLTAARRPCRACSSSRRSKHSRRPGFRPPATPQSPPPRVTCLPARCRTAPRLGACLARRRRQAWSCSCSSSRCRVGRLDHSKVQAGRWDCWVAAGLHTAPAGQGGFL